ncbi:helix-turn-helix transcriptional regulator [Streptomyces griseoaurantiacus]|uniref:Helix-turn-helix transcriptional regulator n=1 Tax=Streptomyces griseoaurantiacus TaxID=68213 RepID=A0A7W2DSJ8_9ACTN|nr:helix-turn-helix transcriptional regulator [Streptomyces griseoaurantiacus]MBA5222241.1 helix-turn-helix transcriptional regulator [Streptomyces griseoaurantiacus]
MTPVPTRCFSGERFRAHRKAAGYTETRLSGVIGINRVTINAWARGAITPSLKSVLILSDVLGCTVDDLLAPVGEVASDGPDA